MMIAFWAGDTPLLSISCSKRASPWPLNVLAILSLLVPFPEGTLPNPIYTALPSQTPIVGKAASRTLAANSSWLIPLEAEPSILDNRSVIG